MGEMRLGLYMGIWSIVFWTREGIRGLRLVRRNRRLWELPTLGECKSSKEAKRVGRGLVCGAGITGGSSVPGSASRG